MNSFIKTTDETLKNKKIGIWGLGLVGKSALSFFSSLSNSISVLDKKKLSPFDEELIKGHKATNVDQNLLPEFLDMNDIIIPSPGINLAPFSQFKHKWVTELDIFHQYCKKPTIAITGSVGKTTITHILFHLLNKCGIRAVAAGNIGKPMLDVLSEQDKYNVILLELSSFQLQYNKQFAPDVAIVTNFFPNHLDHHADIEEYLNAKGQLLFHQTEKQTAFIPMEYVDTFWSFVGRQKISWIGSEAELETVNRIVKLSDVTCKENWQLIIPALEHFNIEPERFLQHVHSIPTLEHRMQRLDTKNGITFYNDSKSTLPQATLNAVQRLQNRSITLFLGGLSKGLDRTLFIKKLKTGIKSVICFGAEAEQLHAVCKKNKIASSTHATLEEAFSYCMNHVKQNDTVLFSPAGSSFDLYENYVKRGKHFQQLVVNYRN